MLSETGNYQIDTASNGRIAWQKVQENDYDLVITDIRMPEIDGIELLKLIRQHNSSIPIIVVTAFASIETAVEALQSGAANFLKKPFSIDEINTVTSKALKAAVQTKIQSKTIGNISKSFSVVTKSKHSIVDPVFQQIRDMAKNFGFSNDQLHMNLYLCLTEAIANAIDHGNKGDPDKEITIDAIINSDSIIINISDEGNGFNLNMVPDPTQDCNISKSRGRGIFLMRCYMDSVSYSNNGSKVTMIINAYKKTTDN
jgi:CheY-like chemotaxis protein